MKTYFVTPHSSRLDETVLMTGRKICFYGEMWLIFLKLSLLPLPIWSTAYGNGWLQCSTQAAHALLADR